VRCDNSCAYCAVASEVLPLRRFRARAARKLFWSPNPTSHVQDRTLKLWDLRRLSGGFSGSTASAAVGAPGLLHTFGGFKHGVSGCTVHLGTAICRSRGKVALTPLAPPFAAEVQLTRLTSARGAKSSAHIAGLALLPCSRVLAAGCEDGLVKVCA